ncbi:hypothetical protein WJX79_009189 [Trebouxia sp. C0005]
MYWAHTAIFVGWISLTRQKRACVWQLLGSTGANLQLPRKVPLRIEPKSYFANERTFCHGCTWQLPWEALPQP